MDKGLVLIVNPYSSPRYTLYEGGVARTLEHLSGKEAITAIGLKVVAPGAYFLYDRVIDAEALAIIKSNKQKAVFETDKLLKEIRDLRKQFPDVQMIGVSDSSFHITKPDYAWNYGISIADADQHDIKRFGFGGLALESVVQQLADAEKLPHKMVLCHIDDKATSLAAVYHGRSIDTTTGYSPLEGLIGGTTSGSIDSTARAALQHTLGLDVASMDEYLHEKSGLLGLSGRSSSIQQLLQYEAEGDHYAHLALQTYVHAIHKGIGQMTAALGGADVLVFSGSVAETCAELRTRIVHKMHYLDFALDDQTNINFAPSDMPVCISEIAYSRPVFVVASDEASQIFRHLHASRV